MAPFCCWSSVALRTFFSLPHPYFLPQIAVQWVQCSYCDWGINHASSSSHPHPKAVPGGFDPIVLHACTSPATLQRHSMPSISNDRCHRSRRRVPRFLASDYYGLEFGNSSRTTCRFRPIHGSFLWQWWLWWEACRAAALVSRDAAYLSREKFHRWLLHFE